SNRSIPMTWSPCVLIPGHWETGASRSHVVDHWSPWVLWYRSNKAIFSFSTTLEYTLVHTKIKKIKRIARYSNLFIVITYLKTYVTIIIKILLKKSKNALRLFPTNVNHTIIKSKNSR